MSDATWTQDVKPYLGKHHELDKLWQEHQQFENELAELDKNKWLTTTQEQERRTLQRKKLHGKDRMISLARQIAS